jgi:hypothetical protein
MPSPARSCNRWKAFVFRLLPVPVLVVLALPIGSFVAGCGSASSQVGCLRETRIGTATHRIRNGTCVTSGFENVVRLTIVTNRGTFLCTGTLIAPNVVISAGHCVNPLASSPSFVISQIQVEIPRLNASALVTHYYFTGGSQGQPLDSTPDWSILRLDRNLAPDPAKLSAQDPELGQQMLALGYGFDGNAPDGNGKAGDLLLGLVRIDFIGSATKNIRTLAAVQPISDPKSQDTCAGDSGGPLVATNSTNVIVGVLSGGNYVGTDTCKNSADSYWTPVRHHRTEMLNRVAQAETLTNSSPPPDGWFSPP